MRELSLYVHIPFCVRKCLYCDFLSFSVGKKRQEIENYVNLLKQELRARAEACRDYTVKTVFFGGGTPSLLGPEQMQGLMDEVRRCYALSQDAEITMEMNPGTASADSIRGYRAAGINRLSIGLQSASDEELRRIGRIHTYDQFLHTYEAAREAGFDNINVDLMAALPGQDTASYRETLRRVTALSPEHISAYSLILEEGTWLCEHRKDYVFPTEDEERGMYLLTQQYLAEYGYHRYEISNYAREGRECRHNKVYWQRGNYLGVGLGAASMVENVRWSNPAEKEAYRACAGRSGFPEGQALTEQEQMEEFMFLGLRLTEGVREETFSEQFGKTIRDVYGEVIDRFAGQGLLLQKDGRVYLTPKGVDVSNYVMADFLFD